MLKTMMKYLCYIKRLSQFLFYFYALLKPVLSEHHIVNMLTVFSNVFIFTSHTRDVEENFRRLCKLVKRRVKPV